MMTGTIHNTVKLQTMTSQWMQKKDSGNILSKEEKEKRANWTEDERLLHEFQQQLIDEREHSKKQEIMNKVVAGETLTPEEEAYLEQHDPTALKSYRDSKAEKKAYEEKLRNCKTKDEVNRLKTETVGGYLSSMKKIVNNPMIPLSAKLAKAKEILAKLSNIEDAEKKFMQTLEYQNLPTEGEEAVEASKERNAECEKLQAENNVQEEGNSEKIADMTQETKDPQIAEIEEIYKELEASVNLDHTKNLKQKKDSSDQHIDIDMNTTGEHLHKKSGKVVDIRL